MAANKVLPGRIRYLREKAQLKRCVLSELCGLIKETIKSYEEGTAEPLASSLEAMADYFHVTTDYLLGREEK